MQHTSTVPSTNTSAKAGETVLEERLRFEGGIARLAKALLTEYGNNKNSLENALDHLVATIRADWAHLCRHSRTNADEAEFSCVGKTSALAGQPPPALTKPCRETLNRWHRRLFVGDPIIGPITTFPPEDQAYFTQMGIRSILMMPVISGKRFFGFLSIEDKQTLKEWRDTEIQLAQTAALMIGAFLAREEKEANLRKSTEAAELANRMKSAFVSNISHEIRTPLNGIIGFTEILRNAESLEDVRRHASTIMKEARYLLELVESLLDHAKLEAKAVTLEPAPLRLETVLNDISTTARLAARQKGIAFLLKHHAELPSWVEADGNRLRQVLSNLVGNGVKFTEKGVVSLETDILEQQNDRVKVRFSVQDTGIGVDKASMEKIFERFRQADESTTRRFSGTGLGITIAEQLVRLMGGRIQIESEVGMGSHFWFDVSFSVLPEQTNAVRPLPADSESATAPRRLKVLVAEDHPTNQMVIRHHLERNRHEATIASNGLEVLELCESDRFDIILMDVQMPEMDGIETTRRVRASGGMNRDIPIVAVTASAEKAIREACLRAGMNDVITKPLLFDRIVDILSRWAPPSEAPPVDAAPAPEVPGEAAGDRPEAAPPLDCKVLMTRLDGDVSFAKVLLNGFIDQTDRLLGEMAASLDRSDMDALRQSAHTIKGGAMNIVAEALQTAASALEESTRRDADTVAPLLARLEAEFHRLKHYVQNVLTS